MGMGILNIILMILFNTFTCILLPRIITLNWLELYREFSDKIKANKENKTVIIEEI